MIDNVKQLIEYRAYQKTGNYIDWEELTDTNGQLEEEVRSELTLAGYIDLDQDFDDPNDDGEWFVTGKGWHALGVLDDRGFDFGDYD